MKIFGHEYGMLYTVGAQSEIAKLCPGEDLTKLLDALKGKTGERNGNAAEIVCILSRWHEKAEAFKASAEGRDYEEAPVTREILELIDVDSFGALLSEAFAVMNGDSEKTVETEDVAPSKKEKKDEVQRSA